MLSSKIIVCTGKPEEVEAKLAEALEAYAKELTPHGNGRRVVVKSAVPIAMLNGEISVTAVLDNSN